jgi:hypothetical protein
MASISAVLDHQTVRVEYLHQPSQNTDPVDLTVKLIHKFVSPSGIHQRVVLNEKVILAKYQKTDGLSGLSDVQQTVELIFQNPKYLKDLFVEVDEVRNNILQTKEVPVLQGDLVDSNLNGGSIVSNPIRNEDLLENTPVLEPEKPMDTIQVAEPPMRAVIFDLTKNTNKLKVLQSASRITLSDNKFVEWELNAPLFNLMENSIDNSAPNPSFLPATSGKAPQKWEFEAPGFIISTGGYLGDISGTFKWKVTASNPNWVNAFNKVKLKMLEDVEVLPGLPIVFSIFIKNLLGDLPFSGYSILATFKDVGHAVIGTSETTIPISAAPRNWAEYSKVIDLSEIPAATSYVSFSVSTTEVQGSGYMSMEFYLPQLEFSIKPTSHTVTDRIQDIYQIQNTTLKPPFTIAATINYYNVSGMRGILDSTYNGSGLKFNINRNTLIATILNSNAIVGSAVATFTGPQNGDEITVKVSVDAALNMKLLFGDNVLISSVAGLFPETSQFLIGSHVESNRTLSSELHQLLITYGG